VHHSTLHNLCSGMKFISPRRAASRFIDEDGSLPWGEVPHVAEPFSPEAQFITISSPPMADAAARNHVDSFYVIIPVRKWHS
jgi:hypothetical protein